MATMYRYFLILAAFLFFGIGCQQEIPPQAGALSEADIAQITSEIEEISTEGMRRLEQRDPELLDHGARRNSIDGNTTVINGKVFWTMQEFLEMVRPNYERFLQDSLETDFEIIRQDIHVLSKSVAFSVAHVKQNLRDKNGNPLLKGAEQVVTTLYVKPGDEWKVLNTHQSDAPSEAPG